ncbi:hypothetical protein ES703_105541 [subsurface metagenome]
MALSRAEVIEVAKATAEAVVYQTIQKRVNEQAVECEICSNKDELYHLTSIPSFQGIVEASKLEPSGHSKSVSLSANIDHTYGGRVKITLDRQKLPQLQPMCYYENHTPADEAYFKFEAKCLEESSHARSLDDIRAEVGMQPEIYKKECEWFTHKPLPIPEEAIKKIQYYITPPGASIRVDCEGYFPHYIDLTPINDYPELLADIKRVRDTAQKAGAPFEVTSCFPFIRIGWGEYIELNEDNLGRLTKDEKPIISHEAPPEVCRDILGCRREG